uniref:titin homolog n=1 Tax=Semicossyphus pulcher TaxID=241346 RepID=UPI0037E84792
MEKQWQQKLEVEKHDLEKQKEELKKEREDLERVTERMNKEKLALELVRSDTQEQIVLLEEEKTLAKEERDQLEKILDMSTLKEQELKEDKFQGFQEKLENIEQRVLSERKGLEVLKKDLNKTKEEVEAGITIVREERDQLSRTKISLEREREKLSNDREIIDGQRSELKQKEEELMNKMKPIEMLRVKLQRLSEKLSGDQKKQMDSLQQKDEDVRMLLTELQQKLAGLTVQKENMAGYTKLLEREMQGLRSIVSDTAIKREDMEKQWQQKLEVERHDLEKLKGELKKEREDLERVTERMNKEKLALELVRSDTQEQIVLLEEEKTLAKEERDQLEKILGMSTLKEQELKEDKFQGFREKLENIEQRVLSERKGLEVLKKDLNKTKEEVEAGITIVREERDQLSRTKISLEREREKLSNDREIIDGQRSELKQKEEELMNKMKPIEMLRVKLQRLSEKLSGDQKKQMDSLQQKDEDVRMLLTELEQKLAGLTVQKENMAGYTKLLEREMQGLRSIVSDTAIKREDMEKQWQQKLEVERHDLEKLKGELKKEREDLERVTERMNKEKLALELVRSDTQEQIVLLEEEKTLAKEERDQLEKILGMSTLKEQELKEDKFQGFREKLENIEQRVLSERKGLEVLKKDLNKTKEEVEAGITIVREERDQLSRTKISLEREREKLSNDREIIDGQRSELKQKEEELMNKMKPIEMLRVKLQRLSEKLSGDQKKQMDSLQQKDEDVRMLLTELEQKLAGLTVQKENMAGYTKLLEREMQGLRSIVSDTAIKREDMEKQWQQKLEVERHDLEKLKGELKKEREDLERVTERMNKEKLALELVRSDTQEQIVLLEEEKTLAKEERDQLEKILGMSTLKEQELKEDKFQGFREKLENIEQRVLSERKGLEVLKKDLNKTKEEVEAGITIVREERDQLSRTKISLEREREKLSNDREIIDGQRSELKQKEEELMNKMKPIEMLRVKLQRLSEKLSGDQKKQMDSLQQKDEDVRMLLTELEQKLAGLTVQKENMAGYTKLLEREMQGLRSIVSDTAIKREDMEKQWQQKLEVERHDLEKLKGELKKEREDLERVTERMNKEKLALELVRSDTQEQIVLLEEEKTLAKEERDQLEKILGMSTLKEQELKEDKFQGFREKLENIEQRVLSERKGLEVLKKDLNKTKEEVEAGITIVREERDQLSRTKISLEREREKLSNDREIIDGQRSELKQKEEELMNKMKPIEMLRVKLQRLSEKLSQQKLEVERHDLEKLKGELKKEREDLERVTEKMNKEKLALELVRSDTQEQIVLLEEEKTLAKEERDQLEKILGMSTLKEQELKEDKFQGFQEKLENIEQRVLSERKGLEVLKKDLNKTKEEVEAGITIVREERDQLSRTKISLEREREKLSNDREIIDGQRSELKQKEEELMNKMKPIEMLRVKLQRLSEKLSGDQKKQMDSLQQKDEDVRMLLTELQQKLAGLTVQKENMAGYTKLLEREMQGLRSIVSDTAIKREDMEKQWQQKLEVERHDLEKLKGELKKEREDLERVTERMNKEKLALELVRSDTQEQIVLLEEEKTLAKEERDQLEKILGMSTLKEQELKEDKFQGFREKLENIEQRVLSERKGLEVLKKDLNKTKEEVEAGITIVREERDQLSRTKISLEREREKLSNDREIIDGQRSELKQKEEELMNKMKPIEMLRVKLQRLSEKLSGDQKKQMDSLQQKDEDVRMLLTELEQKLAGLTVQKENMAGYTKLLEREMQGLRSIVSDTAIKREDMEKQWQQKLEVERHDLEKLKGELKKEREDLERVTERMNKEKLALELVRSDTQEQIVLLEEEKTLAKEERDQLEKILGMSTLKEQELKEDKFQGFREKLENIEQRVLSERKGLEVLKKDLNKTKEEVEAGITIVREERDQLSRTKISLEREREKLSNDREIIDGQRSELKQKEEELMNKMKPIEMLRVKLQRLSEKLSGDQKKQMDSLQQKDEDVRMLLTELQQKLAGLTVQKENMAGYTKLLEREMQGLRSIVSDTAIKREDMEKQWQQKLEVERHDLEKLKGELKKEREDLERVTERMNKEKLALELVRSDTQEQIVLLEEEKTLAKEERDQLEKILGMSTLKEQELKEDKFQGFREKLENIEQRVLSERKGLEVLKKDLNKTKEEVEAGITIVREERDQLSRTKISLEREREKLSNDREIIDGQRSELKQKEEELMNKMKPIEMLRVKLQRLSEKLSGDQKKQMDSLQQKDEDVRMLLTELQQKLAGLTVQKENMAGYTKLLEREMQGLRSIVSDTAIKREDMEKQWQQKLEVERHDLEKLKGELKKEREDLERVTERMNKEKLALELVRSDTQEQIVLLEEEKTLAKEERDQLEKILGMSTLKEQELKEDKFQGFQEKLENIEQRVLSERKGLEVLKKDLNKTKEEVEAGITIVREERDQLSRTKISLEREREKLSNDREIIDGQRSELKQKEEELMNKMKPIEMLRVKLQRLSEKLSGDQKKQMDSLQQKDEDVRMLLTELEQKLAGLTVQKENMAGYTKLLEREMQGLRSIVSDTAIKREDMEKQWQQKLEVERHDLEKLKGELKKEREDLERVTERMNKEKLALELVRSDTQEQIVLLEEEKTLAKEERDQLEKILGMSTLKEQELKEDKFQGFREKLENIEQRVLSERKGLEVLKKDLNKTKEEVEAGITIVREERDQLSRTKISLEREREKLSNDREIIDGQRSELKQKEEELMNKMKPIEMLRVKLQRLSEKLSGDQKKQMDSLQQKDEDVRMLLTELEQKLAGLTVQKENMAGYTKLLEREMQGLRSIVSDTAIKREDMEKQWQQKLEVERHDLEKLKGELKKEREDLERVTERMNKEKLALELVRSDTQEQIVLLEEEKTLAKEERDQLEKILGMSTLKEQELKEDKFQGFREKLENIEQRVLSERKGLEVLKKDLNKTKEEVEAGITIVREERDQLSRTKISLEREREKLSNDREIIDGQRSELKQKEEELMNKMKPIEMLRVKLQRLSEKLSGDQKKQMDSLQQKDEDVRMLLTELQQKLAGLTVQKENMAGYTKLLEREMQGLRSIVSDTAIKREDMEKQWQQKLEVERHDLEKLKGELKKEREDLERVTERMNKEKLALELVRSDTQEQIVLLEEEKTLAKEERDQLEKILGMSTLKEQELKEDKFQGFREKLENIEQRVLSERKGLEVLKKDLNKTKEEVEAGITIVREERDQLSRTKISLEREREKLSNDREIIDGQRSELKQKEEELMNKMKPIEMLRVKLQRLSEKLSGDQKKQMDSLQQKDEDVRMLLTELEQKLAGLTVQKENMAGYTKLLEREMQGLRSIVSDTAIKREDMEKQWQQKLEVERHDLEKLKGELKKEREDLERVTERMNKEKLALELVRSDTQEQIVLLEEEKTLAKEERDQLEKILGMSTLKEQELKEDKFQGFREKLENIEQRVLSERKGLEVLKKDLNKTKEEVEAGITIVREERDQLSRTKISLEREREKLSNDREIIDGQRSELKQKEEELMNKMKPIEMLRVKLQRLSEKLSGDQKKQMDSLQQKDEDVRMLLTELQQKLAGLTVQKENMAGYTKLLEREMQGLRSIVSDTAIKREDMEKQWQQKLEVERHDLEKLKGELKKEREDLERVTERMNKEKLALELVRSDTQEQIVLLEEEKTLAKEERDQLEKILGMSTLKEQELKEDKFQGFREKLENIEQRVLSERKGLEVLKKDLNKTKEEVEAGITIVREERDQLSRTKISLEREREKLSNDREIIDGQRSELKQKEEELMNKMKPIEMLRVKLQRLSEKLSGDQKKQMDSLQQKDEDVRMLLTELEQKLAGLTVQKENMAGYTKLLEREMQGLRSIVSDTAIKREDMEKQWQQKLEVERHDLEKLKGELKKEREDLERVTERMNKEKLALELVRSDTQEQIVLLEEEKTLAKEERDQLEKILGMSTLKEQELKEDKFQGFQEKLENIEQRVLSERKGLEVLKKDLNKTKEEVEAGITIVREERDQLSRTKISLEREREKLSNDREIIDGQRSELKQKEEELMNKMKPIEMLRVKLQRLSEKLSGDQKKQMDSLQQKDEDVRMLLTELEQKLAGLTVQKENMAGYTKLLEREMQGLRSIVSDTAIKREDMEKQWQQKLEVERHDLEKLKGELKKEREDLERVTERMNKEKLALELVRSDTQEQIVLLEEEKTLAKEERDQLEKILGMSTLKEQELKEDKFQGFREKLENIEQRVLSERKGLEVLKKDLNKTKEEVEAGITIVREERDQLSRTKISLEREREKLSNDREIIDGQRSELKQKEEELMNKMKPIEMLRVKLQRLSEKLSGDQKKQMDSLQQKDEDVRMLLTELQQKLAGLTVQKENMAGYTKLLEREMQGLRSIVSDTAIKREDMEKQWQQKLEVERHDLEKLKGELKKEREDLERVTERMNKEKLALELVRSDTQEQIVLLEEEKTLAKEERDQLEKILGMSTLKEQELKEDKFQGFQEKLENIEQRVLSERKGLEVLKKDLNKTKEEVEAGITIVREERDQLSRTKISLEREREKLSNDREIIDGQRSELKQKEEELMNKMKPIEMLRVKLQRLSEKLSGDQKKQMDSLQQKDEDVRMLLTELQQKLAGLTVQKENMAGYTKLLEREMQGLRSIVSDTAIKREDMEKQWQQKLEVERHDLEKLKGELKKEREDLERVTEKMNKEKLALELVRSDTQEQIVLLEEEKTLAKEERDQLEKILGMSTLKEQELKEDKFQGFQEKLENIEQRVLSERKGLEVLKKDLNKTKEEVEAGITIVREERDQLSRTKISLEREREKLSNDREIIDGQRSELKQKEEELMNKMKPIEMLRVKLQRLSEKLSGDQKKQMDSLQQKDEDVRMLLTELQQKLAGLTVQKENMAGYTKLLEREMQGLRSIVSDTAIKREDMEKQWQQKLEVERHDLEKLKGELKKEREDLERVTERMNKEKLALELVRSDTQEQIVLLEEEKTLAKEERDQLEKILGMSTLKEQELKEDKFQGFREKLENIEQRVLSERKGLEVLKKDLNKTKEEVEAGITIVREERDQLSRTKISLEREREKLSNDREIIDGQRSELKQKEEELMNKMKPIEMLRVKLQRLSEKLSGDQKKQMDSLQQKDEDVRMLLTELEQKLAGLTVQKENMAGYTKLLEREMQGLRSIVSDTAIKREDMEKQWQQKLEVERHDLEKLKGELKKEREDLERVTERMNKEKLALELVRSDTQEQIVLLEEEKTLAKEERDQLEKILGMSTLKEQELKEDKFQGFREKLENIEQRVLSERKGLEVLKKDLNKTKEEVEAGITIVREERDQLSRTKISLEREREKLSNDREIIDGQRSELKQKEEELMNKMKPIEMLRVKLQRLSEKLSGDQKKQMDSLQQKDEDVRMLLTELQQKLAGLTVQKENMAGYTKLLEREMQGLRSIVSDTAIKREDMEKQWQQKLEVERHDLEKLKGELKKEREDLERVTERMNKEKLALELVRSDTQEQIVLLEEEKTLAKEERDQLEKILGMSTLKEQELKEDKFQGFQEKLENIEQRVLSERKGLEVLKKDLNKTKEEVEAGITIVREERDQLSRTKISLEREREKLSNDREIIDGQRSELKQKEEELMNKMKPIEMLRVKLQRLSEKLSGDQKKQMDSLQQKDEDVRMLLTELQQKLAGLTVQKENMAGYTKLLEREMQGLRSIVSDTAIKREDMEKQWQQKLEVERHDLEKLKGELKKEREDLERVTERMNKEKLALELVRSDTQEQIVLLEEEKTLAKEERDQLEKILGMSTLKEQELKEDKFQGFQEKLENIEQRVLSERKGLEVLKKDLNKTKEEVEAGITIVREERDQLSRTKISLEREREKLSNDREIIDGQRSELKQKEEELMNKMKPIEMLRVKLQRLSEKLSGDQKKQMDSLQQKDEDVRMLLTELEQKLAGLTVQKENMAGYTKLLEREMQGLRSIVSDTAIKREDMEKQWQQKLEVERHDLEKLKGELKKEREDLERVTERMNKEKLALELVRSDTQEQIVLLEEEKTLAKEERDQLEKILGMSTLKEQELKEDKFQGFQEKLENIEQRVLSERKGLEVLKKDLNKTKEEVEAGITIVREERDQLSRTKISLEREREKLSNDREIIDGQRSELKQKEEELMNKMKPIEMLRVKLQRLSEKLSGDQKKQMDSLQQKDEDVRMLLTELQQKLAGLTVQKENMAGYTKLLEREMQGLRSIVSDTAIKREDMEKQWQQKLEVERHDLEKLKGELKKEREDLERVTEKMNKEKLALELVRSDTQEQIVLLEEEKTLAKEERDQLEKILGMSTLKEQELKEDKFQGFQEKLENIEQRVLSERKGLEVLKKDLNKTKEEVEAGITIVREERDQLSRTKISLEREREKLSNDREIIDGQRSELKQKEEELMNKMKPIEMLRVKLQRLSEKLSGDQKKQMDSLQQKDEDVRMLLTELQQKLAGLTVQKENMAGYTKLLEREMQGLRSIVSDTAIKREDMEKQWQQKLEVERHDLEKLKGELKKEREDLERVTERMNKEKLALELVRSDTQEQIVLLEEEKTLAKEERDQLEKILGMSTLKEQELKEDKFQGFREKLENIEQRVLSERKGLEVLKKDLNKTKEEVEAGITIVREERDQLSRTKISLEREREKLSNDREIIDGQRSELKQKEEELMNKMKPIEMLRVKLQRLSEKLSGDQKKQMDSLQQKDEDVRMLLTELEQKLAGLTVQKENMAGYTKLLEREMQGLRSIVSDTAIKREDMEKQWQQKLEVERHDLEKLKGELKKEREDLERVTERMNKEKLALELVRSDTQEQIVLLEEEKTLAKEEMVKLEITEADRQSN